MERQKWEYLTRTMFASSNGWKAQESKEFYQKEGGVVSPSVNEKEINSPIYLIEILNNAGAAGWELIHMEPIFAGKDGTVGTGFSSGIWSNAYFCVFKRPRQEEP